MHKLEVHQIELEIQNEELRATRIEAEAAAARYAELWEFAPMAYATLAADGTIRAINLAGASLLGTERGGLVGRRLGLYVSAEDRTAFAEFLEQTLAAAEEDRLARELTLESGERTLHARLTASPPRRPDSEILLAIEDVSERKRHEQQRSELLRMAEEARGRAEEANKAKDAFLATLSHELRNPLAPISNSVFILQHSQAGTEQARRAAAVIHRQVSHLSHLVDDLLDMARIDRGKIRLHRGRVDLNEVARDTVEDLHSTFVGSGVGLELAVWPAPVVVEADRDRLGQVLGNLLQNAAKFSQRGGTTRVAVSRSEGYAVMEVTDDGEGMTPDLLSRLFQPFMQADSTLHRGKGGLGLGMALAKDFVELQGGRISAHSDGIGKGSRFEVRLPLAAAPHAAPPDAPLAPSPASRRILVIEDNVDAADSLRDLLELNGHRAEVAYDGPEGLAKARELKPDVVLCDIGLPGMDGCEVARAIRADASLHGTFLVALSGYARPEDVRRAEESGFQRHMAKPPDPRQLEDLLRRVRAAGSPPG